MSWVQDARVQDAEVQAAVDAVDTDDRFGLVVNRVGMGYYYMLGWYAYDLESNPPLEYGDACHTLRTAEGIEEGVAAVRAAYENSPVAGKTRRP